MLKIHKSHSKSKLLIRFITTSICITFGLLGFYYLTYTPELSHAESITYEKTIEDITYMQEMTPSICQSMELEKQYQLTDIRKNFDGTQPKYWIARLKDNNCWMTQNLDLDIPAEGFSARDTDIKVDWGSSSAYKPESTQITSKPNFGHDINNIKSWDPAQGGAATYCNDGTTASKCKKSDNPTTSVNNGHDAQGNYYSWGAATAGQAASLTSDTAGEQATQSICPKGWRLPLSGSSNNAASGSFYNLLNQYGLTSSASNTTTGFDIYSAPLYFVYGGHVYYSSLGDAGSNSRYWSSMANAASHAYSLDFSTSVNPSDSNYRYAGFSVRCVAPGGEKVIVDNDNIKVTIKPQISLDMTDEVNVEKGETNLSTANLDVKVSSNQKYSIGISATNSSLTSTTSEVRIPAKSGLLNVAENGWGIKLKDNTNYTALTTSLQTFYTASGAEIKTIPFTIGISTAPDIPNGEYSTDITVTATQN